MSARLSARPSAPTAGPAARRMRPSRRPAGRRTAVAATAVAAAAVCGTLLTPAAHAAPGDAGLDVAVSGRTHETLHRGSGAESFVLTVSNPTDAAQDYRGMFFGEPGGPSPILGKQLRFGMTPVTAPATDVTIGQEDWSALFGWQPAGSRVGTAFSVPAHGSYSWKVTVGFAADFPANDDGVLLDVDHGDGTTEQLHFDLPPALKDGKLTGVWGPAATVRPGGPGRTWYELKDTAGGAFDQPLRTLVSTSASVGGLDLEVLSHGRWVPAKNLGAGQFELPLLPEGFAGGGTYRYDLRFTVPNSKGTARSRNVPFTVLTGLAAGNTSPIVDMDVNDRLRYDSTPAGARPGSPTPASGGTATATPTRGTDPGTSGTASGSTSGAASGTPATSGATATTPAPVTTGQLAHTGSDHAGLFAGLAAIFAGAGAVLIAAVARRRGRASR